MKDIPLVPCIIELSSTNPKKEVLIFRKRRVSILLGFPFSATSLAFPGIFKTWVTPYLARQVSFLFLSARDFSFGVADNFLWRIFSATSGELLRHFREQNLFLGSPRGLSPTLTPHRGQEGVTLIPKITARTAEESSGASEKSRTPGERQDPLLSFSSREGYPSCLRDQLAS